MGIDTEDDIVQDFLVESREILEALGGQLVELEQRGDDRDLLNAVFRGFHTIKGGAGFLSLDALVSVCHRTEDLFNLLRNGERTVTPELMDHVLRALDVVNDQFDSLEAGREPPEAPPDLLAALEQLIESGQVQGEAPAAAEAAQANGDEITDDEFEQLLDALDETADGKKASAASANTVGDGEQSDGDEITEDEFESLLDQLHGKGQHSGKPDKPLADKQASPPSSSQADDDLISEDEFDQLLDQLHGEGKGPATRKPAADSKPAAAPRGEKPAPSAPAAKPTAAAGSANAEPEADKASPKGETSVRVDTAKLDDIMNLVGELVLVRNRLSTLRAQLDDERMGVAVGDLELVTSDLQAAVMQTRMQPIRKVFGRFPRLVRDLARSLGKDIELELRGEDTDLDKNLVEALADPLIHLVRNSCDHGVETPEERRAAGKPATGKLMLSAEQEGDHILLVIADDGKGMDPEMLRRKVIEKGIMDAESAARLDDKDCFNLIFQPGFSTKDQISDVSGRGVGMDVVKTRISQLNGTIDIDSTMGVGTTLRIKVPLTLAILPTLMVTLDGRKFAVPMSVVSEIFELDMEHTKVVDGRRVVMVRKKAMPLFFLDRWIQRIKGTLSEGAASGATPAEQQVVTVVLGNQPIGLVVDEVLGLEEVVIKPLGAMLQGLPGLAGSTITGDGRIALIIDIPSLVKSYGSTM
ncbi:MAG: chemotaxis protein CheA [Ectothiorhodospiraceae bacterium]|nr:chemotaxis protein CheA [Ectothiorhodospiraceae bacterium]MCH8504545.1 chemotaxis protein CheA [Ectothiorhodospiraceae bacterium]